MTTPCLDRTKPPPDYASYTERAGTFYQAPRSTDCFLTIPAAWDHYELHHNPPGCQVGAVGQYTPDVDTRRVCFALENGDRFIAVDWSNESIKMAHTAAWASYWYRLESKS